MAWVACNINGTEVISDRKGHREKDGFWSFISDTICLPSGSIKKLIGRDLSFDDEPVELT